MNGTRDCEDSMKMAVVIVVVAVAMLGVGVAGAQDLGAAKWIAAPWSTVRDGAEADGSRPMPMFRREFAVRGRVRKAELRIAGLGQFEARMDGGKVGAAGLHEAWTDYRKTVMYETYDVTKTMHPGPHALGVMLGNGMYNVQRTVEPNGKARFTKFEGSFGAPKMIAELRLMYSDGRVEEIDTDERWRAARGPVVFSSTFGGEDYDARKEVPGWDRVEFADGSWSAAVAVDGPGGKLMAAVAPEVVQTQSYLARKETAAGPGRTVYDLGQNFAGAPKIEVQGPAGAVLKVSAGELLNADGTVYLAARPVWWTYTLKGGAAEVWEPQFMYYGFRYLQAEWVGEAAKVVKITGVRVTSGSAVTGTFESSNALLNSIHKLIVEAMHNNEASLMTDCPHREKLGWLEETHLVAAGLMFNNDLEGLYKATDRNIADAQKADGMVPTIAPQYTMYPIYDDSPEWGSAAVLAPWAAYRFYGDRRELERSYPAMKAFVKYLESRAEDGIVTYGLGDWYDIGPGAPGVSKLTTAGVTGTLMLYEDAVDLGRVAALLGRGEDAAAYAALAEREKAAFNARFWDAKDRWYDRGSQTANGMALALGVVPEERRAGVLAHLVADIHAHEDHVTSGEVGYPYLLRALMAGGRNDVAMAMLMRKDAPSYGSQLAAGATALTEAWDASPKSSQDHFMLGGAEEWFYRGLGGIDLDLTRTGTAERITVRPRVVEGVDWVKCGYASKLGKVESDWKRVGGEVTFEVTVPVEATVVLPDRTVVVGAGVHRFVVKGGS